MFCRYIYDMENSELKKLDKIPTSRKPWYLQTPYWGIILFTVILGLIFMTRQERPLPVLGNGPVAPFQFVNQDSISITNKTFDDKIYIADFFFTSCTTICPEMHRIMKNILEKYRHNPDVMLLSHTIDFKYDTPSKLKKYAEKLGVDGDKWQFAYGTKAQVYGIAEKSYLSAVMEDTTAKENFVHQGYLLLVDKKRRLRGAYDSGNSQQVAALKKDIEKLLKE